MVAATTRTSTRSDCVPPDPLELLLLERAENLGLERERQIADLVEEERAAMGELEAAGLALCGAGERPLLVSEQLALEQRLRNRRAIDGDERSVIARAERVQRSGEQLLACSALAFEQDRGIRRGRAMELLRDLTELAVLADDPRRTAPLGQFLFENDVLGEHPALRDRPLDHQQQVIGLDGLGQKVHRPFAHRGDCILDASVRSHHDHGQIGVQLLRCAKDAEAIANGQLEIGQDDDRTGPTKLANGLGLITRLEHGMAVRLEGVPEHGPKGVFVFDDEYGEGGHSRIGSVSLPHPTGGDTGAPGLFLDVADRFGLRGDLFLDALEFGGHPVAIVRDRCR